MRLLKKIPGRNRCWPWAHNWKIVHVSVPIWDPGARGIFKRCLRCPVTKAK